MSGFHLTGPVLVDDSTVLSEAWIEGDVLRLDEPARGGFEPVHGWALPGFVDVHCHVGLDAGGATDRELALKQASADRDAGTLLIRDAGSPLDTSFVHGIASAPRLIRAGRFIARPKRYLRGYAREIEVGDLPRVAAEEARRSDGWIKLIADWIDRDLGADADLTPLWPDDVLAEAVAAAHAEGARVTAHTFATESIDPLLAAGVDCVEHGTGMTREQMRRATAAGLPVTPTLLQVSQFESFAAQGEAKFPRFAARMRAMYERRYEQAKAFHEEGMQILVGTDAGSQIGHGSLPLEAAELVHAGIPAPVVVAAASWGTRKYLGVAGIAEGASADVVVLDADPREDITALATPAAVILRGTRFV